MPPDVGSAWSSSRPRSCSRSRTDEVTDLTEPLLVFAAGSLRPVFDGPSAADGAGWPGGPVRFRFANARDLADAIEAGADADAFVSASPAEPARLYAAGTLETPRMFARNRVVVGVVRSRAEAIRSVDDLATSGVRVVIETAGIPLGNDTRQALGRLDPGLADRILANVVHEELDVRSVVARLTDGSADAAFLYATDVQAATDEVALVELPPAAEVEATYVGGVLRRSQRRANARAWLDWLLGPAGQAGLAAAGFSPPPSSG